MPRRKRQFLDDDSDSSAASENDEFGGPELDENDPDAREERSLFEDPYKRKRRRKNGKEDAIYGVFGSDDEDEGFGGRRGGKTEKRSDWTKAPAFVSKDTVTLNEEMDVDKAEKSNDVKDQEIVDDDEDTEGEDDLEEDGDSSDESSPSRPASPRVREPEDEDQEEERPRFGGLGIGASKAKSDDAFSAFSRGGIGSSKPPPSVEASPSSLSTPAPPDGIPTAFGNARTQRSFFREGGSGSSTPKTPVPLNASERAHFSKIQNTFGARMLAKMGWQAGTGLGAEGEGIVNPVESKLRPKGMGLAFKGFKEKTEQAKAEARRRGEIVSDDEEAKASARKGKKADKSHTEKSDAWKKPKKIKKKLEHKTYEQIIAEAGQEAPQAGIGQIIDATGATPREVSSLADVSISSWTPTADPMRLPEIRHNLRLITEACKSDLDGLAREAKALQERRNFIRNEDARLRKRVDEEAELISRLQQVHLVVDDINAQAKEMASVYEASLDPFSASFSSLLGQYPKEFDRYRLDEIVVAAIAPIVRRMLMQWQPLEEPTKFTSTFRLWRQALKMNDPDEKPENQIRIYGSSTTISSQVVVENPMTPYESLMWNAWLPKIRSAINNDWSTEDPQPAVRLYEAWSNFLPPFVRDNFFDQLVLPKVQKAVGDWNARKSKVPLKTLVFPWLPHVGLRLEDVLDDARRKMKSVLRAWTVSESIPGDLSVWKDVFDVGDWDTMLLKYIVPKLGTRMREDFRVNPRNQDMKPLQDILLWETFLRPSILSQILESEFFPKWLDILHIWLIQPNASLSEVAKWYEEWKGSFSENVQHMPAVANGFTRGLQMMNKAIELGSDAPTLLPRPDHRVPLSSPKEPKVRPSATKAQPARTQEITFRSIVEEYASQHNLLFIPTGRAHDKSRMPLFRVSATADGKGGLLVYILDDAVWAPDGDEYRAIALEDMALRATKEKPV